MLIISNQNVTNTPTDYIFKHGNSIVRLLHANNESVTCQNKSGNQYTISYFTARRELVSLTPTNLTWRDELMKPRYIISDIETKSLEARYDPTVPVWCVGFYNGTTIKKVIKWGEEKVKKEYEKLLADPTVIFVFHNAAFDVAALRIRGISIPKGRYLDTMVMSYVLRPGSSENHSLDNCAYELLGETKLPKPSFEEYSPEMAKYCGIDCRLTHGIHQKLHAKLKADEELYNYFINVEMPYVECIIDMQTQGIVLNREKLIALREEYNRHIQEFLHEIQSTTAPIPNADARKEIASKEVSSGKCVGDIKILRHETITQGKFTRRNAIYTNANYKWSNAAAYNYIRDQYDTNNLPHPKVVYSHNEVEPFNPNSPDHKIIALMLQGWKPDKFSSKTKKPSVDKTVLDSLDLPLAKLCRQYSQYFTIVSRTVEPALELTVDETGNEIPLRCNMNQCTTTTTRLSSSSPNLQNIPARNKEFAYSIRSAFIARPGHKLVVGDLDRIEIVALAHYLSKYVGHHALTERLLKGEDVHQTNSDLWGLTAKYGKDDGRKKAKNGVFTLIYGGGVQKFADTIAVSKSDAQIIWDTIHEMSPEIFELREIFIDEALDNQGFIHTTLGNRVYIPQILSKYNDVFAEGERLCGNYPIQGVAAAVFKTLQVRAMPICAEFDAHLLLVVHDEAIYEVREELANDFARYMTECFTDSQILHPAPVSAKFFAADDWYTAKSLAE